MNQQSYTTTLNWIEGSVDLPVVVPSDEVLIQSGLATGNGYLFLILSFVVVVAFVSWNRVGCVVAMESLLFRSVLHVLVFFKLKHNCIHFFLFTVLLTLNWRCHLSFSPCLTLKKQIIKKLIPFIIFSMFDVKKTNCPSFHLCLTSNKHCMGISEHIIHCFLSLMLKKMVFSTFDV